MRVSVITPNFNGEKYLEKTIQSVLGQRTAGLELEYIVVDGGSTDGSLEILNKYSSRIDKVIVEHDEGPSDAINKGLSVATGDLLGWLNADDIYFAGSLERMVQSFCEGSSLAFVFGKCLIINEDDSEIRHTITRFKEMFFSVNSRFTYQCINYISQPAVFFSRKAYLAAGPLRTDLVAAWDYDLFLRLWRQGKGSFVPGPPVAGFRWHEGSISGQNFHLQFKEELEAAQKDAGGFSLQYLLHQGVRWGIVSAYSTMAFLRNKKEEGKKR